MVHAIVRIGKEEGPRAYFKGVVPRMFFHSLSGGICWTAYEYLKYILGAREI